MGTKYGVCYSVHLYLPTPQAPELAAPRFLGGQAREMGPNGVFQIKGPIAMALSVFFHQGRQIVEGEGRGGEGWGGRETLEREQEKKGSRQTRRGEQQEEEGQPRRHSHGYAS